MDIEKEREAFLKWHYQAYLLENPEIDMQNAQYIYDYAHKNALCAQLRESHFAVWQAAKAQAVPDGFVLVPKEIPDSVIERLRYSSYHWGDGTRNYFTPVYQMMIEAAQGEGHE